VVASPDTSTLWPYTPHPSGPASTIPTLPSFFDLIYNITLAGVNISGDTSIYYAYGTTVESCVYDGDTVCSAVHTAYSFNTQYGIILQKRTSNFGLVDGNTLGTKNTRKLIMLTTYQPGLKNHNSWTTRRPGWNQANKTPRSNFITMVIGSIWNTLNGIGQLTAMTEMYAVLDSDTPTVLDYTTTWEAVTSAGTDGYDFYGNLLEWKEMGLHKSQEYDNVVHTYPSLMVRGVGSLDHKIAANYDFRFGQPSSTQGPYVGQSPSGVTSFIHYDGYGRIASTSVKPVGGSKRRNSRI